jgi:hypothetical protein
MAWSRPQRIVSLVALLLFATTSAVAQPTVTNGTVASPTDVFDPGGPKTVFAVRSVMINASAEFALVSYSQQTDNGPTLTKAGWIFLSNDRLINYKMGMISLLRDALADPTRAVGIQIVTGTENSSRPVIAAVAIGPKPN